MALGGHFGPLGADFGLPDCFGYFYFLGGVFWGFFGAHFGPLFWGPFGAHFGPPGGQSWPLGAAGAHFGAPGGHFGASSGRGPGGGGKGAKKAENCSK